MQDKKIYNNLSSIFLIDIYLIYICMQTFFNWWDIRVN